MPTAEEFDEFYVSTRRDLVHQTFALTGDLVASRSAVRDAYVAARHHWDKLGRADDPSSWVRPRAWSIAQRRHTARPWHREKHIDADQTATLEALHQLPDSQRRTLVLTHLSELPLADIARELGRTQPKVEELFDAATATMSTALGCDPDEIGAHLVGLGNAADTVKLPRPTIVRRNGLRRRRNFAVVGSAVIAAITVAAGAFVAVGAPAVKPPSAVSLVSTKMLLTVPQIAALSPNQPWTTLSTTDNTKSKRGLNTMCQTSRFADPDGLGTWVRKFASTGASPRSLVQTVEISSTPGAARKAYDTTVGWYAGCTVARIQLIDAYTVTGVGDQAQILRMRIPNRNDRAFVVAIARTGALTTSTVLETATSAPLQAAGVGTALATSVQNLCASPVAGQCVTAVQTVASQPPPSGEAAGMLATADLPAVNRVAFPWVGTKATPVTTANPAATTCDNANFAAAGAASPSGRSFLIPDANLPARFGISETIGRFASARAAAKFVNQVEARMKACPDKELASTISQQVVSTGKGGAPTYGVWRLENQVNKKQEEVVFWMGITQVGPYVAQVSLTPVARYDVSRATFTAMLLRARSRLLELP